MKSESIRQLGIVALITMVIVIIPTPFQVLILLLGLLISPLALLLGLINPRWLNEETRYSAANTCGAMILYCFGGLMLVGSTLPTPVPSPSPTVAISPVSSPSPTVAISPVPSPTIATPNTPRPSPSASPTPQKTTSPNSSPIKEEKIPIRLPKIGCECPYDKGGDGKRECGIRSSYYSYTLGGGSRPICYFGKN